MPPGAPAGAIDIDDLVAEFEQTAEGAEAVSRGRQWVAEAFYGDRPASIAKFRLAKGWSQAELARQAGNSQSYVARLEAAGWTPSSARSENSPGARRAAGGGRAGHRIGGQAMKTACRPFPDGHLL